MAPSSDELAWLDGRDGPDSSFFAAVAAVAYGAFSSNECPVGYARIQSEGACESAAAIVGKSWKQSESRDDRPKGCFFFNLSPWAGVYLNTHPTGRGDGSSQPLCAGGAPIPARSLEVC